MKEHKRNIYKKFSYAYSYIVHNIPNVLWNYGWHHNNKR